MKKEIEALARAYQEVQEKLVGGQKALDQDNDNDIDKDDFAILRSKKKKKGKDDPKGENGETAVMNPKGESKSTTENVRTADKKPEVYVAPDGKKHTRMVPVNRDIVKKESTDMSIREKLLSVIERKDHGNTDQKQPHDDQDSPGAKQMRKDHEPKVQADIKKATDDNAAAEKKAKVSPKNSTDKDVKGDMKVINPPEDITKKAGMKESFSTDDMRKGPFTHEVDHAGDPMAVTKFAMAARAAGIKAAPGRLKGPSGHPTVRLGHSDENHIHKFLKKHYDSSHTMDDTKASRVKEQTKENKSFSSMVASIGDAYQSIYENFTHEVDHYGTHADLKDFIKKAKDSGINAKIHTMHGSGGGNPVVRLGHKDENHIHNFLKKHYASDQHMDDTKASRIGESLVYENFTHEVDHYGTHADAKDFVKKAQNAGILAKIHTAHGAGGMAPVIHLGHKDENRVHHFLKKHYDSQHTMDDTKMARISGS